MVRIGKEKLKKARFFHQFFIILRRLERKRTTVRDERNNEDRMKKWWEKYSPPDPCGTYQVRVGCYVPILTHCPQMLLHRSKGKRSKLLTVLSAL